MTDMCWYRRRWILVPEISKAIILEKSLEEGPECKDSQTQTKSKGFMELKIEAASERAKGVAQ